MLEMRLYKNNKERIAARFEQYEEDAQSILKHIGSSSSIEKIHSSDHPHYQEAYNSITRDIVAHIFQTDIKIFGYSF